MTTFQAVARDALAALALERAEEIVRLQFRNGEVVAENILLKEAVIDLVRDNLALRARLGTLAGRLDAGEINARRTAPRCG